MKRLICILIALLLLTGCTGNNAKQVFTKNEQGNLVSNTGTEYTNIAMEGVLYYLGETEFVGRVKGEKRTSQHMGLPYQTGMFAIKGANNGNILIRRIPDNEWCAIYRKASLPAFDFSVDNCIRLEFVKGTGDIEKDAVHTTCAEGITDKAEIAKFLSEIRMQKDAREAGLYDSIKKPDGMLENCYVYGIIYGFFADEPNLAIRMEITSFNDLAYSVAIDNKEYVLPAEWLQKLEA